MQKRKKHRNDVILCGSVPSMLKKAKTVLSDKQYHNLCRAVDETVSYTEKGELIKSCVQAKNTI